MARSRSPVPPPGAHGAHGPQDAAAPSNYPPQQPQAYPGYAPERPYDGYAYPPTGASYAPPQQPAQSYGQAGYGYAEDPRYAAPAYAPPARGPAPSEPAYTPAYDQYGQARGAQYPVAEPVAYDRPTADPRGWQPARPDLQGFHDVRQQPTYDPAPQHAPRAYPEAQPDLRGGQYDQWPGHVDPRQDPRGYDLGHYAPQADGDPHFGHGDAQRAWPGHPSGYPSDQLRFDQQIEQNEGKLQPYDQGDDEPYEEEEEEPPRKGRGRALLIVLSLVGAIGLGGGLAYGYKMFFATPMPKGGTPVVKAPSQPAKTQPADPGGRKFANTESKVMERLPSDADPAGDDTGGARRVQVIPVTRDGALAAPPPSGPPAAPAQVVTTTAVPGLTVVGGGPRPTTPSQIDPLAQQTATRAPVAPLRPQIVARAEPEADAQPEPKRAAAPQQSAPVVLSPAQPPAQPRAPAPQTAASAAGAATAAGAGAAAAAAPTDPARKSTGFVAVLASQKSRMEALSLFADLQQQYGSVLGGKVPDVQEADLSSRNLGTVYRLVVGPPGPRDRALALCNQLKSAGYQGCWVTAF